MQLCDYLSDTSHTAQQHLTRELDNREERIIYRNNIISLLEYIRDSAQTTGIRSSKMLSGR